MHGSEIAYLYQSGDRQSVVGSGLIGKVGLAVMETPSTSAYVASYASAGAARDLQFGRRAPRCLRCPSEDASMLTRSRTAPLSRERYAVVSHKAGFEDTCRAVCPMATPIGSEHRGCKVASDSQKQTIVMRTVSQVRQSLGVVQPHVRLDASLRVWAALPALHLHCQPLQDQYAHRDLCSGRHTGAVLQGSGATSHTHYLLPTIMKPAVFAHAQT